MKNITMLQTGYRQLAILSLLYEKNLSKAEIIENLYSKYGINLSKETFKLDINTLIEAGFKIKRGHKGNNYKISLDKNFTLLKFSEFDISFFSLIKEYLLEAGDFNDIYQLKKFYKKLLPFFQVDKQSLIMDFNFLNSVEDKILDALISFKKSQETCNLTYKSKDGQNKEKRGIIKDILVRNGKIYADCIFEDVNNNQTLRTDNITKAEKSETEMPNREFKIRKTKYLVKKEYFENYPLENNERIIGEDENAIEIELLENNPFFIVQRILTLGENCIKIKDEFIKNLVIKSINETLEIYN